VLAVCGVLYCLMCGWQYSLGGPPASNVVCSLFAYLITPYYTKFLVTCYEMFTGCHLCMLCVGSSGALLCAVVV
jgi:hypothetical protein